MFYTDSQNVSVLELVLQRRLSGKPNYVESDPNTQLSPIMLNLMGLIPKNSTLYYHHQADKIATSRKLSSLHLHYNIDHCFSSPLLALVSSFPTRLGSCLKLHMMESQKAPPTPTTTILSPQLSHLKLVYCPFWKTLGMK